MAGQTRVNAGQSLVPGRLSLDVARQSTLINSLLLQTLAVSGVANSTIIGGGGGGNIHKFVFTELKNN